MTDPFIDGVSDRYRARQQSTDPGDPDPVAITGVEIIAILTAIVAACDALNPGWRQWSKDFFERLLPPWDSKAEQLRNRAARAIDPESAGFFHRGTARADRAFVLREVRAREILDLRTGNGRGERSVVALADAILGQTADSTDREIADAVDRLAPPK